MKKIYLLILLILISISAKTQSFEANLTQLTLQEAISIAKERSISYQKASSSKDKMYWQWQAYKASYKPQLTIRGTLPDYNKTNTPVVQPDGSIEFRSIMYDNSRIDLSINQNIGLTGGQFYITSNVQRFDNFNNHQIKFNGNPTIIGFNQPLFGFNKFKWEKKIEPLRYEESEKQFVEEMEIISRETTSLFFDLLLAQINLSIAQKNLANNDTILKIGELRYKLGRMPKNELLQLQLSVLNSQKGVTQAKLDCEVAMLNFKSYIGFTDTGPIELVMPETFPSFHISEQIAINEAFKNRQKAIELKRVVLEAQRDVAKVKGENGFSVNLYGTFGLTNQANSITEIYNNTKDQQTFRLGFEIPILSWGKGTSLIKTAEANRKLVESTAIQEENFFIQQINSQVRLLEMLREQTQINAKADSTAQERYEISKNRYMLGDYSITDLNIAWQEKDKATRENILGLRDLWVTYYNLRCLTLFDFVHNQPL